MSMARLSISTERIRQQIEALAAYIDTSKPGWTRRPFTPWYEQGRLWLKNQMQELGLNVSQDAGSNLIGALPGSEAGLKAIMVGSHTDTVTGGGRFDGIIGVIAGLELARVLKEEGIVLRHPLEIVDFTAEEPSEFGISTIGSRAMVDNLTSEMLLRKDQSGLILRDAIDQAGGAAVEISEQARRAGDIALYLELHIEQGPVLEQTGNLLGVVTGIVGIDRFAVTVEGAPNHAGTTPMGLRADALTGASELVLALEEIASKSYGEPIVGTVGKLFVEPNAANVIPGRVTFELEIRSLSTAIVEQAATELKKRAAHIAARRGIGIRLEPLSRSEPIRVSDTVQNVIREACSAIAPTLDLPSGAGHDANQLARIAPIGMIFVPSVGGRSHCPEEWTAYEQVASGVEAIIQSVLLFDQRWDIQGGEDDGYGTDNCGQGDGASLQGLATGSAASDAGERP
ncbi:Zn-dependent hydrolase [Paenibacillus sinopodophylli]|uniref:Zn-dependent hydrolase n=1 Tax=Paenibacillus sinopodophylli TaxID=1837342 RepID=UPI00110CE652|nr:Zn-dependent hydrolase [Paenibacillus sinopodophylli]